MSASCGRATTKSDKSSQAKQSQATVLIYIPGNSKPRGEDLTRELPNINTDKVHYNTLISILIPRAAMVTAQWNAPGTV